MEFRADHVGSLLGGNLLTAQQQFAKLRLVADVARAVWGAS